MDLSLKHVLEMRMSKIQNKVNRKKKTQVASESQKLEDRESHTAPAIHGRHAP